MLCITPNTLVDDGGQLTVTLQRYDDEPNIHVRIEHIITMEVLDQ